MGAPSVAFVQQYKDTITLLAQQIDTRLRPTVMVDTNWSGEKKFYDQYSTDSMVEILTRYQDTPVQSPNHQRRMVTAQYFVSNTLEDPTDAVQMLVDPKSAYMQAKVAAAARKTDAVIIAALGGTAYSGQTGTTANTLAAANKITHSGTGMTIAKLLAAKKALDKNEADKEERFIAVNAEAVEDLLNTTQITSSDYNSVKALAEGSVDTFLGFKFVRTEQLALDSTSTYRLCYAYQKKGIQLAIQKEAQGRLDERPDKNYAWQVYMSIALGAVRLDENMVFEIPINE